jgi:hypothetical protein
VVIQLGSVFFIYIGDGQLHTFDFERLEAAALDLVAGEAEALT